MNTFEIKTDTDYATFLFGESFGQQTRNAYKLIFYLEDLIEGIRSEMIEEGKPFQIKN